MLNHRIRSETSDSLGVEALGLSVSLTVTLLGHFQGLYYITSLFFARSLGFIGPSSCQSLNSGERRHIQHLESQVPQALLQGT